MVPNFLERQLANVNSDGGDLAEFTFDSAFAPPRVDGAVLEGGSGSDTLAGGGSLFGVSTTTMVIAAVAVIGAILVFRA